MADGVEFKKHTWVRLPFDMRHSDPTKNYGIGGLEVWFVLEGPKGAVQFKFHVAAYLPSAVEHLSRFSAGLSGIGKITGWDVGYHAREPQYEGQGPMEHCNLFNPCYYDGSSLRADAWAEEIFSIRGERPEKRLWEKLEQEYMDLFG